MFGDWIEKRKKMGHTSPLKELSGAYYQLIASYAYGSKNFLDPWLDEVSLLLHQELVPMTDEYKGQMGLTRGADAGPQRNHEEDPLHLRPGGVFERAPGGGGTAEEGERRHSEGLEADVQIDRLQGLGG